MQEAAFLVTDSAKQEIRIKEANENKNLTAHVSASLPLEITIEPLAELTSSPFNFLGMLADKEVGRIRDRLGL